MVRNRHQVLLSGKKKKIISRIFLIWIAKGVKFWDPSSTFQSIGANLILIQQLTLSVTTCSLVPRSNNKKRDTEGKETARKEKR
jgi:hypothetical protein